jgi:hypothetical protein
MLATSKGSPRSAAPPSAPVAASVGADPGWSDAMKRDLAACKTPADYRAWSEKWALALGGQTGAVKPDAPMRPQTVSRRDREQWKPG